MLKLILFLLVRKDIDEFSGSNGRWWRKRLFLFFVEKITVGWAEIYNAQMFCEIYQRLQQLDNLSRNHFVDILPMNRVRFITGVLVQMIWSLTFGQCLSYLLRQRVVVLATFVVQSVSPVAVLIYSLAKLFGWRWYHVLHIFCCCLSHRALQEQTPTLCLGMQLISLMKDVFYLIIDKQCC